MLLTNKCYQTRLTILSVTIDFILLTSLVSVSERLDD